MPIPAISAELPCDCTELVLYLESTTPLPVPLSSKNFLNSHRERKGTLTHKGDKGIVSQGWKCHFWYELSLHSVKLLAAATITAGKGDWRICLFLGASSIRALERLREGSVRELPAPSIIRNAALQLPASFAHAHKWNWIKCAKRTPWYHVICTLNFKWNCFSYPCLP